MEVEGRMTACKTVPVGRPDYLLVADIQVHARVHILCMDRNQACWGLVPFWSFDSNVVMVILLYYIMYM